MIFTTQIDENISLALPQLSMAQELFELINNNRDHLSKWLGWVNSTQTALDSETYIQESLKKYLERKGLPLIILYQDKVAGCAGFISIDDQNNKSEIGYWLGKEFTGKGIMTQTVKILVEYGFKNLGLNRVYIRAAYENATSRRVAERLGFKKEGVLRQEALINGKYHNVVIYSLLGSEWQKC